MLKVIASLCLVLGVAISQTAIAGNDNNPSKDINTIGLAKFPAQIEIVNDEGVVKTYHPAFAEQTFNISDDNFFQMGDSTRCDPYLGKTAKAFTIPLTVTERFKSILNKQTIVFEHQSVGPVGAGLLLVRAGSNVYGRCQSETLNLTAITIQAADPKTGNNDFEHPFEIQWSQVPTN